MIDPLSQLLRPCHRPVASSAPGFAGAVTVANTSVTADTRIFLTAQSLAGTAGALAVSARTPGTGFTITSSSTTDKSLVAWMLVEPV
jgi:hypothetical protein